MNGLHHDKKGHLEARVVLYKKKTITMLFSSKGRFLGDVARSLIFNNQSAYVNINTIVNINIVYDMLLCWNYNYQVILFCLAKQKLNIRSNLK